MAKPDYLHFFIDPNRCIGCQSCMQACSECDTHRGESMIHLEYVNRAESVQTVPVVCMHCEQPTCAEVCPADAIKRTGDGVVQSARKPRCIACGNCVVACPFGVPELYEDRKIMMKTRVEIGCPPNWKRLTGVDSGRSRSISSAVPKKSAWLGQTVAHIGFLPTLVRS